VKIRAPDHVMTAELDGETVLLSLADDSYYRMDEVSARMWRVMTSAPPLAEATEALLAEFDVERETLERDLREFVDQLVADRLVEIAEE